MTPFDFIQNLFNFRLRSKKIKAPSPPYGEGETIRVPQGRVSKPNHDPSWGWTGSDRVKIITPLEILKVIPVLRHLSRWHPELSQGLYNTTQLGNTGHRIKFDPGVKAYDIDKMRRHLRLAQKRWLPGSANTTGFVNKLLTQLIVGGCVFGEWVVKKDLSGIDRVILLKAEDARWGYSKAKGNWELYQKVRNELTKNDFSKSMVKLNPATSFYYGMGGDTDSPYGIPVYLPAIKAIMRQGVMQENIDRLLEMMGVWGFLTVLASKPFQVEGESEAQYNQRLENLLTQIKDRVEDGVSDGVVVGYEGDYEFDFNSTAKTTEGATELYKMNDHQIFSSTKGDPTLFGRSDSTSETHITITFTKLLSELTNYQNIIKEVLEFGYALELRLAGFKFDYLSVEFRKSTLQDYLKFQQAEEIKIRNISNKYMMGIISQEQAADELEYDKPDQKEPRGPLDESGKNKRDRQAGDNKADRETRAKSKSQGTKGSRK